MLGCNNAKEKKQKYGGNGNFYKAFNLINI